MYIRLEFLGLFATEINFVAIYSGIHFSQRGRNYS